MHHVRPSLLREVLSVMSSPEEFQNQVEILPLDESNTNVLNVRISPNHGPFQHASFIFKISNRGSYPDRAPSLECLTPIFHPNINWSSSSDHVCLNILHNWTRRFGLKELLHALLFLLYEPNPDDPNNRNAEVPEGMTFNECVKLALRGEKINDVQYPPNEAWCNWALQAGLLTYDCVENKFQPLDHQTSTDNQLELQPQISTDFSHSIAQVEFESIPSFGSTASINTCASSYGLTTLNITISPVCPNITSSLISRYYFIDFYDGNTEVYVPSHDEGLNFLPICENDLPYTVQTALIQRWHVEYGSGFRYSINYGMIPESLDSLSLDKTDSEICSVHDDNHSEQQQQLSEVDPYPEIEPIMNDCQFTELERSMDANKNMSGAPSAIQTDVRQQQQCGSEQNQDTGPVLNDHECPSDGNDNANAMCSELQIDDEQANSENYELEVQVTQIGEHHDTQDQEYPEDYLSDDESWNSGWGRPSYDWLNSFCIDEYGRYARCLKPMWWIMYQTRWPPSFAPSHVYVFNPELNKPTDCIISRASIGQLRADLNYVSMTKPTISHVILVDSLALSPLSPILNHLARIHIPQNSSSIAWRSIEWLSLSWAFKSAPYSPDIKRLSLKGSLPLACLCLVSNWLAYGSRIEMYNCLGYSRRRRSLYFESIGLVCLTPARLSYGPSLVLDGWPLWLAVQTTHWLSSICSRIFNFSLTGTGVATHFVFTDIDEI